MEKKKMSELTQEEKILLLNHWLLYYGKAPVTLDVLEKIHYMIEEDADKIMDIAILNFISEEGSTPLINTVRFGKFSQLSDNATAFKEEVLTDPEKKKLFEETEDAFLEEIVGTYNNPEPDVPMSLAQILGAVFGIDDVAEKEVNSKDSKEVSDAAKKLVKNDKKESK